MHWIHRIEAEYDQPIHELLYSLRDNARRDGTTLRTLAEDWGITRNQLEGLCRKLDIHWPRGIGGALTGARKPVHYAVVNGRLDTLHRHAKRAGISPSTVRYRVIIRGMTPEEALQTDRRTA